MTEVPGWGKVGEREPDPALPEPFDEWRQWPVPAVLSDVDTPDDVLRHAWHVDQNIYAAECLFCNPRHVDIEA